MKRFADTFGIPIIFGEISTSLNIVIWSRSRDFHLLLNNACEKWTKMATGGFVSLLVCAHFL